MPFRVPTRTWIGAGSFGSLGEVASSIVDGVQGPTALVVTDAGLVHTRFPADAAGALDDAGFRTWVLDDVSPNPRVQHVDDLAERFRQETPSVIVALGGGSVIDAAKGLAVVATNPGSIRDYEGRNRFVAPPLPVIAIPTTCGTGSEVTWVSVLTDLERRTKISVKGDALFPTAAIVDPELLVTLPSHLIASTGVDALTHAVEAFVGKASNPVSDQLAAAATRMLLDYLSRAVMDISGDAEARGAVMEASTIAGMAFGNADVGGVHCLSEAIGGRHDLPHGLLNAVLLAPVIRYHGEAASRSLQRLGALAGVSDVIAAIEALVVQVGIPAFPTLGVPRADYGAIADAAEANGSNGSNPREMRAEDYRAILEGLG